MMLLGYNSICREKQFSDGRGSILPSCSSSNVHIFCLMTVKLFLMYCSYRILGRGHLQTLKCDLGVQGMNV